MRNNILLNLSVLVEKRGLEDYKSAIDEAYSLSKELNIGCSLNYLNQYRFVIKPTMTQEEIDEMKNQRLIIGL